MTPSAGGPGQPGHSFCAFSPQLGKAPCAAPDIPSLFASPSEQGSIIVHSVYAGRPCCFRYLLIVATQIEAGVVPPEEEEDDEEEEEEEDDDDADASPLESSPPDELDDDDPLPFSELESSPHESAASAHASTTPRIT